MRNNTLLTALKNRTIKKIAFAATLLFSLIPYFGYSTHIVGGELNYKCLGGDLYEIKLRVYRDCYTGVPPFDNPAVVGIFDVNNVLVTKVLLNFPGSTKLPPTLAQANPCVKVPTNICVEVAEYVGTVSLPARVGGYQMAYQRCCRNPTIDNLTNPGNQGATYYAKVPDQTVAKCNSNPVFTKFPPIFVCVNSPIIFDHSATDIDGDSIFYDMCAPYTGATSGNSQPNPPAAPPYTSVTYKSPYTATNAMGGVPLTIDPKTGLLTGTPNTLGQYVVGVCASEYRKGVLISTTKRDFQFNVVECQPDVVAAAATSLSDCQNHTVTFVNNSSGTTNYYWNFGDLTTLSDTSHLDNPNYTYPSVGTYTVKLIAFHATTPQCNDTLVFTVTVDTCKPCGMTLAISKIDATCGATNGCTKVTPVIDTKSVGSTASGAATMSWAHTTSGTDRFLLVEVATMDGSCSGVTYAGQNLTFLGNQTATITGGPDPLWIEMYYLVNPPTGSNQVVVTFPTPAQSSGSREGHAISFTGVDQASPLNGTVTKANGNSCPATTTIPTGPNELIVDMIGRDHDLSDAMVPLTGQTALYAFDNIKLDGDYMSSTMPGTTGSVTVGYDWPNCATNPYIWMTLGISIKPSCGTGCTALPTALADWSGNTTPNPDPCPGTGINIWYFGAPDPIGTSSSNTYYMCGATYYTISSTDWTFKTEPVGNACPGTGSFVLRPGNVYTYLCPCGGSTPPPSGNLGSATVSVTGGTPTYYYNWSPGGQTTNPATNLTAGTYTVTVTDKANCVQTASVIIDASSAIVLTPSKTDPSTCGATDGTAGVTVSGNVGPVTYLWNNNQTTPTISGLPAGTYTVKVVDSAGCSKSTSITIGQPTVITLTASKTDVKCSGGSTGTATANTPSGGVSPFNYSWSTTPVQNTQTATNLKAGYYVVTVTDAGGCTGTAAVTIVDSSMVATATSIDAKCYASPTGSATISVTGGTSPFTYSWNTSPVQNTVTATNLMSGTYVGIVTDNAGCKDTVTVTINEPTQIVPEPKNTSTVGCAGSTNGSAEVFVSGGTAPYSYLWCNGQNTSTAGSLSQGKCFVTVTDANGCAVTDTVNIVYPPVLSLTSISSNVLCNGIKSGSATVNPSGGKPGYTYSWSTIPVQNTQTAVNLGAGTYSVVVTDNNGCTATLGSIVITEPSAIVLAKSSKNVSCPGANDGSATVTASGGTPGYTYSWNTTPAQNGSTASGLPGGIYTITVTDVNSCNATASVTILDVGSMPVANFTTFSQPTCYDGLYYYFYNSSTSATSYKWIFSDGTTTTEKDPGHEFKYGTTTKVSLIAFNGPCSDTLSLNVVAKPFSEYITPHIPNVFTPNGDNLNDLFEIKVGNGLENCVQINIFDRWGLKMYDNSNGVPWDGRTKSGKPVPDGTYFYLVVIGENEMHGTLSLLR